MNPRRFPLPVFKTGALGRYASPPWANLPSAPPTHKTEWDLKRQLDELLDDLRDAILVMRRRNKLCMLVAIGVTILHSP